MKKCIKVIGIIIAIVLVLAALLSQLHFVAEADHDCSGEDCPICKLILFAEQILKSFFIAAVCAILIGLCTHYGRKKEIIHRFFENIITLITLRVKLSA